MSRYQAMLAAGRQPSNATLYHRPDVCVWNRLALYYVNHGHETVSVTYYTSAVADHDEIETIEQELRVLDVAQQHRETLDVYLTPFVKKRSRNQRRSKGVDIRLCVDMLGHVHRNNVDTVALFTGDGDYEPLIDEAKRSGKRVVIGAFSEGLSRRLKIAADYFLDLDKVFLS